MIFSHIHWPAGLDEATFLAEYWQQKPLLIRQALPEFDTPLSADELAGLSLEPDTTPRLITRDANGAYHLEHGPFEPDRFDTLTGNDWSLLVTDVEKHIPDLAGYLQPFAFLPNWRIDDLMISYAPVGASVGAHIDEYDVFLLQAGGSRRWSIESPATEGYDMVPDSDLKLIAAFCPTDTWELTQGDLLYLPAGIPHHGVASVDPCMTWSVGFRAPTTADFVMRMAEMICENLPQERYTDGMLTTSMPGEIDSNALTRFSDIWARVIGQDNETLARMTGRFLTESANATSGMCGDEESLESTASSQWQAAPFSRLAWRQLSNDSNDPASVELFVDGEAFVCSQTLAIDLCRIGHRLSIHEKSYSSQDRELLAVLISNAALIPVNEEAQ